MRLLFLAFFLFAGLSGVSAFAQDDPADPGLAKRLELATELNKVMSPRENIEMAVGKVSESLPETQRRDFVEDTIASFDFERLNEKAIKSMAEVFSQKELEKMLDYFGSEEAKSIATKMPVYQELIAPELSAMVNTAIMRLRMGSGPGQGGFNAAPGGNDGLNFDR